MELGILVAGIGVILAYRWFNKSLEYMTKGIVTLVREADRFNKEESDAQP